MTSEQQAAAVQHASNNAEMAVAFVVESSLTVASDWTRVITEYVSPMLRRLYESNPNAKRRLAFITYAMADTKPSPLLCKRFFLDYQPVTKEMRESPTSLGIGMTNSGGNRGMAALEGLVAAIELFDVFTSAFPRGKLVLSHIIHIASVSPDSSVHPRFNDSPKYDAMTWDTMADEMRNKSINFNTINLLPNLKRFPELHAKTSKDALKPFFKIHSSHSVLLAGIPSLPQKISVPQTPAPVKRSSDVHSTPDPKRARLGPPMDVSPKVQTPNTPSSQAKPSPLLTAQPKVQPRTQTPVLPPAPAPSMTPAFPQVPQNTPQNMSIPNQNFLTKYKELEARIRGLHTAIQNAQNAGNTAMVQSLTQELNEKQPILQRAKQILSQQVQLKNANLSLNQETPIAQSAVSPGQPPMGQQALATMLHKRTASGSGPVAGPGSSSLPNNMPPRGLLTPPANPSLAAQMQQMQKMADQQRARSMQQNMAGPSGMQPAGPPSSHIGPSVDQRPPNKESTFGWQGSLVFSGTDAQGNKKDNVVWVIGKLQDPPAESRIDTWPTTMQLSPANKPAVPMQDLQAWIQNNRPILCMFQPQPNGIPDPALNEANFKALITLLQQRKGYAVSAWTLPSGDQGNNILFFPINTKGLAAACFPLTGLPELPVSSRPPGQMLNLLNVNPEFRARLQALPPGQREKFLQTLNAQLTLQMQQRMMAQNAANNPGANNALMGMNAMNLAPQNQQIQQQPQQSPPPQQQQQQQQQQLPGASFVGNVHPASNYGGMAMMNNPMALGQPSQPIMAGMNRPVSSGMRNPIPPNINHEMMQSFMTRNPDGGGMGQ
ncbi:hypothetical protein E4T56_gene6979 [Termitomyces sp. T112]|nr:hypothetical protein E4T56_gene6979 [Termitomyces sp. T112]